MDCTSDQECIAVALYMNYSPSEPNAANILGTGNRDPQVIINRKARAEK